MARALSLGARAVFVGRPVVYGRAAGGQAGAEAVLRILARKFEACMTLLGAGDTGAI